MKIGGNTTAQIQTAETTVNAIGEAEKTWSTAGVLTGFLDMRSGDSGYQTYDTKIEESTHIFICDYKPLPEGVAAETSRMIINGMIFDIMLIDDPMGLKRQYEIYLKYTGGQ